MGLIILIVVIVLLFGGGFGYWGHNQWGNSNTYAGPSIGIGTILILLLLLYLLHVI